MHFDVIIPPAGDGIDSVQVTKWHLENSAEVDLGDLLLTVETDKISCDIEADICGVLTHRVKEGEMVKVGDSVGYIDGDDSQAVDLIRDLRQARFFERIESPERGGIAFCWKMIQYVLMILGLRYLLEILIR